MFVFYVLYIYWNEKERIREEERETISIIGVVMSWCINPYIQLLFV